MSARMYKCGQRIRSLDELMRQPFVIHRPPFANGFAKIYHRGWFSSWPLRLAQNWLEVGGLYRAEKMEVKARARTQNQKGGKV